MSWRKIVVDGVTWEWRTGREFARIRKAGETKAHTVANWDLLGVTPDTFDRGQWKKTEDGMVKPSHVREYIDNL